MTSLEKYKYQQSLSERVLADGPFRDQLWDLLLKVETAYETRPGMIKCLEKRINTIPYNYSYQDLIKERDEARGPEEEVEPDEDPVLSVTPFSVYTNRTISSRTEPLVARTAPQ